MEKILYFDGVCNLCNGAVDFIIRFDHKGEILFAPLQGETAQKMNIKFEDLPQSEQSLFYQNEKGEFYQKSNAAIRVGIEIFRFGFLLYPLLLIPKFIRDYFYQWVAANRYKFFGKRDTCRLPNKEERKRFLP